MINSLSSAPKNCTYKATVILITCIPLFIGMQSGIAGNTIQPVLSATLEHRFDPTQQVLSRSNVIVNSDGYRLESLPLEQGQVLIANTVSGKTWFVDTARSLVHEVPYSEVDGAPELSEPFISLPGFIDSIPCNINGGTQVADVQHRGRSLERWQCDYTIMDDVDGLPVEQYYSSDYGLVLYSRSQSKFVTELLDISEKLVDEKLFTAPEGLRPVTIEQFIGEFQSRDQDPE